MSADHITPDVDVDDSSRSFDLAEEVQEALAVRVGPLLRAAQNLANCHRVLGSLRFRVDLAGRAAPATQFEEELRRACPVWRDPLNEDGHELVSELLMSALREFESCSGQAGDLVTCLVQERQARLEAKSRATLAAASGSARRTGRKPQARARLRLVDALSAAPAPGHAPAIAEEAAGGAS